MTLINKVSNEMNEEIALSDSELETVFGGCSYQPSSCGGDSSYSYGGPSFSGGYPSYGYGSPSYGSSNYGSPFDTNGCGGSAPSYSTVTTYTVVAPSSSNCSPCNGGY